MRVVIANGRSISRSFPLEYHYHIVENETHLANHLFVDVRNVSFRVGHFNEPFVAALTNDAKPVGECPNG